MPTYAALGASSYFAGHIFAGTAITLGSGARVDGQLLAMTENVALIDNTITNGPCDIIGASSGTLTIYKVDSNGNPIVATTPALAASFNVYVSAADVGVNPPYQAGSIIQGTNYFNNSLPNGTYYVTETKAPEGYIIDSTVKTITISGGVTNLTIANSPTATETTTEVAAAETTTVAPTTTTTPVPVTKTVTGGKLPKTSTPWYNLLLAGIILMLVGAGVWITRKVYEKRSKT